MTLSRFDAFTVFAVAIWSLAPSRIRVGGITLTLQFWLSLSVRVTSSTMDTYCLSTLHSIIIYFH